MSRLGFVAAVDALLALYFAVMTAVMRSRAVTPADHAVVDLLAIVTGALLVVLLPVGVRLARQVEARNLQGQAEPSVDE